MGRRDFAKWTEAEDSLLRSLAPTASLTALAGKFGRTIKSVEARAQRLDIKLKPRPRYRGFNWHAQ